MEAITDLKHILHSGRGKYTTKNDGNEALAGYFSLLNLLNRITIKLHSIEKTNSTIISIPFVFSNIFTSNRANIFYHSTFNNRLNLTKFQFIIERIFSNRSNSTCLYVEDSNCGENAIVKNMVNFKICVAKLKTSTDFIHRFSHINLRVVTQWYVFCPTVQDKLATSCSQIGQHAVAYLTKIPWGHNLAIISKCKSIEFDGFRNKLELNSYENVFGEVN